MYKETGGDKSMIQKAKNKRKFGGEYYGLRSNPLGTNYLESKKMKKDLKLEGFSVRVAWSGAMPHIHPMGRYFVYARKTK